MPQMCPNCSYDNPDNAQTCVECGETLRYLLGKDTVLEERYLLLRVLGCGGFGAVYLAEDSRIPGRLVAVKEDLSTTPQARAQFRTEVNLTIDLEHSGLPKVTDQFAGPWSRQYLVMDYIKGDTLEDIVRKRGSLAENDVIATIKQLLNVVDYLHDHAVIHRDIKPANIKMRPDGKLILVDFGLAKIYVPGQRTYTGARGMGSPGFAAPEQYSTGTDARSDIYSVGAVMYYMLTGEPPPEAIALGAGVSLVPPRQKRPDLSTHIQSVVFKAMALNPANRYQSVAEMRRALISPSSPRLSQPLPVSGIDDTLHSQSPRPHRPGGNGLSNPRNSSNLADRLARYPIAIAIGLGLIFLILILISVGLVIIVVVL